MSETDYGRNQYGTDDQVAYGDAVNRAIEAGDHQGAAAAMGVGVPEDTIDTNQYDPTGNVQADTTAATDAEVSDGNDDGTVPEGDEG